MLFFATSCSFVTQRVTLADNIADRAGFKKETIKGGKFHLTVFSRILQKNAPASIYIEGDGFAFVSKNRISVNPTPKDAFTLKLAVLDDSPNVIYIARPCQYTSFDVDNICENKYWSGSRFSDDVLNSFEDVVDDLVGKYNISGLNIIGYSGGGAIATILASRRKDILSLKTVAGNLNHVAVNNFHDVTQLNDSLNAYDYAELVKNIPQVHFIGSEDKIIPSFVARDFKDKSQGGCIRIYVVDGANHHKGWEKNWGNLLKISCNL